MLVSFLPTCHWGKKPELDETICRACVFRVCVDLSHNSVESVHNFVILYFSGVTVAKRGYVSSYLCRGGLSGHRDVSTSIPCQIAFSYATAGSY